MARGSAYGALAGLPGLREQAASGLLAQVTQGAAGVGLILVARGHGYSLALAGAIAGALFICVGVVRPAQGRLIDRRGARGVTAACAVVHPAALAAIVALAALHAPGAVLVALGALAGLALPPISPSMRALWGARTAESERTAAFSLVYLTQELSLLVGPLLLAGVIALAGASAAVIVVAALAGAGSLWFAASVPGRPAARSARERAADLPAPLWTRELAAVLGAGALVGGVLGAVEVGVPTVAIEHRAAAASGLLIGAISVGGIVGALLFGARRWTAGALERLIGLELALTGLMWASVPVQGLAVLGVLLLAFGAFLNPVLTTLSLLIDRVAPQRRATEAFGWLSTGLSAGSGLGSVVAAALTRPRQGQTAFLIAAIAATAALLLALHAYARRRWARRTWAGRRNPPAPRAKPRRARGGTD